MASSSYYDDYGYGGGSEWYCEDCNMEFNSALVLESHLSGKKHKKQLKALGKLVSDTVQVQTKQTVPKGTPKFVDLTSKLIAAEDSGEPVIGVRYLEEIRKENNPEGYEPKYRCTLCAVTCEVDPMYQHVVGYKHRAKIIWEELNRDFDFNNDKEDIKYYARRIWDDEKYDRRNRIKIKTIVSDEEFIALMPDTQKVKIENELVLKGSTAEIKVGDDPQGALVRAIKSSTCRDEHDAKLAYDVALGLMFKLSEYRTKISNNPDKESEEWDLVINEFSHQYDTSLAKIKMKQDPGQLPSTSRKREYDYYDEESAYGEPGPSAIKREPNS